MTKEVLKGTYPEKCIGCELCVLAAMRQKGLVGSELSPIKILGSENGFKIHLDSAVQDVDIKKIADACPKGCFTIEESANLEIIDFAIEEDTQDDSKE